MIFVQRDEKPSEAIQNALASKMRSGLTELEAARQYYSSDPPPTTSYKFSYYNCTEVQEELDKIYNEKCAYCETKYGAVASRNIEHYRPKAGVTEKPDHPGYWWLAGEWSNLLPSCPPCNQVRHHIWFEPTMTLEEIERLKYAAGGHRAGKGNSFPLHQESKYAACEADPLTNEEPLLINPSVRRPEDHMEWVFRQEGGTGIWDATFVLPFLRPKRKGDDEDAFGKASIAIYGLNRLKLVLERMEYVKHVQTALNPVIHVIQDLAETADPNRKAILESRLRNYWANVESFRAENRPYRGMIEALLSNIRRELAQL